MNDEQARARALVRILDELRSEPAPELDWAKIEARLLRAPKPERRAGAGGRARRVAVPAALLAAAALVFVAAHKSEVPRQSSARGSAPGAAEPASRLAGAPLNGDELPLGAHVTAGNQALTIDHPGHARWILEAHGKASVSEAGERLTVQLLSGALSATVVPNSKPETFAVEVGGARVAAHGTAFRVERGADKLLVHVTEGTVAVEPANARLAPSFLLKRDSRGSFGFDGHTGSVEGNASVVLRDAARASRREVAVGSAANAEGRAREKPPTRTNASAATASATSSRDSGTAPTLPLQPSISDIESGVSSAIALLDTCFRRGKDGGDNQVSASTGMTLSVAPDGTVQTVTFGPPLAPAVEDCAVVGLRNLTFTRSVEGVSFTRLLELSR